MASDALAILREREIEYSICTLVTKPDEYETMKASFVSRGFREPECEFLYIDNSTINRCDGFSGINVFLRAARGRYVILCHQDVELIDDGRAKLDALIAELDRIDSAWGVATNSGGAHGGDMHDLATRITDPHEADVARGPFPRRVSGVDENFIVVKASANLTTSGDLKGFHLYGSDLAILADVIGFHSYAIDFHLLHKSKGKVRVGAELAPGELSFFDVKDSVAAKYRRAFAPRWISAPAMEVFLMPRLHSRLGYNFREFVKKRMRASRVFGRFVPYRR